jgi:uncharacterized protein (TIGR00369 family)
MRGSPWLQHAGGLLDIKMALEAVLDIAVLTGAPPAHEVVTANLSVNHLRPSTLEGESFVARAQVVHSGPTYTLAETLMEDALGRAIAHATSSHLIRPIDPPPDPPSSPLLPVEEPVYPTPDPYLRPLPAGFRQEMEVLTTDSLSLGPKVMAGEITLPLHELLGLRFVDFEPGAFSTAMPATGWLCTRYPTVAAGPIACLAHFALSGAVQSLAPTGYLAGIVGPQSISFLRSVLADGTVLLARGRVLHQVGEFYVAGVEVTDSGGNLVATGSQTSVLIERRRRTAAGREADRVLATVVFTDIVGSTRRAEELGDSSWRQLLAEHDAVVRRQLEIWKGREVKTTGDGFLATFDSPARAVQCARSVRDGVGRLGLQLRIGIHTGECEVAGSDVAGIAVHVAARVQATAEPGEILVSGTVRDLVSGSGLRFTDRGRHQLKGVEGDWQLFAAD